LFAICASAKVVVLTLSLLADISGSSGKLEFKYIAWWAAKSLAASEFS
jgi:hypothetical protein